MFSLQGRRVRQSSNQREADVNDIFFRLHGVISQKISVFPSETQKSGVLLRVLVTIDGVWIRNLIYWTL
jgi:hypothetical protein